MDESALADLIVLACEVGGRWHDTVEEVVRRLAKHRVQNVHPLLGRSVEIAWVDRWWSTLGVAVQDALAASVLAPRGKKLVLDATAAEEPELGELLDAQRWAL